jgi:hypothetical protein
MNGFFRHERARDTSGLILSELLFVVVIVVMLAVVASASLHRIREKTYNTIDLANFRQILKASAIYNSDNNDHMAHPTWGSDLTGPDGWAYLTRNDGRVPGAGNAPGSCAGRDVNTPQFTNQLAFFKKGQVTQYLDDVKTAWCPKDVATRGSGRLKQLWISRPMKVTSYCWNGTVGGYVGPRAEDLAGRTYKVSQFLPTDWQMWESNDADAFNFGDAASNPENQEETMSLRHSGLKNWWGSGSVSRNLPGGGVVGTFGGSAQFVKWPKIYDLRMKRIPAPNELLNGPGYRP